MPIPLIAIAIVEVAVEAGIIAWRAWQIYDKAQTVLELAELAKSIADYKKILSEQFIAELKKEIDIKSRELALLDTGGNTQSVRGNKSGIYKAMIERKIPFRLPISVIANLANSSPIKVPRRLTNKLGGQDRVIDVALRQYTASVCFETADSILDWQSPLKAELAFNPSGRTPYLGSPATRPKRIVELPYTFWPVPKGAIVPDLTIVEDRHKPAKLQPAQDDNVFAVVEMKFPRDSVRQEQMKAYEDLFTANRVCLMRIPEDMHISLRPKTPEGADETKGKRNKKKKV
jgi:VRR-NUC domain